jgi:hypothetical protein
MLLTAAGGGAMLFDVGFNRSAVLAAMDCNDFPRVAGFTNLAFVSLKTACGGIGASSFFPIVMFSFWGRVSPVGSSTGDDFGDTLTADALGSD